MKCNQCGKEINENAEFCDKCGAKVGSTPSASNQDNKIMNILAYLGILFFLPLVTTPVTEEGKFHANQGLLLLIAGVAGPIVFGILGFIFGLIIPFLGGIFGFLGWVWGILVLVFVIKGMINASKGQQVPIPFVGHITLIK